MTNSLELRHLPPPSLWFTLSAPCSVFKPPPLPSLPSPSPGFPSRPGWCKPKQPHKCTRCFLHCEAFMCDWPWQDPVWARMTSISCRGTARENVATSVRPVHPAALTERLSTPLCATCWVFTIFRTTDGRKIGCFFFFFATCFSHLVSPLAFSAATICSSWWLSTPLWYFYDKPIIYDTPLMLKCGYKETVCGKIWNLHADGFA